MRVALLDGDHEIVSIDVVLGEDEHFDSDDPSQVFDLYNFVDRTRLGFKLADAATLYTKTSGSG